MALKRTVSIFYERLSNLAILTLSFTADCKSSLHLFLLILLTLLAPKMKIFCLWLSFLCSSVALRRWWTLFGSGMRYPSKMLKNRRTASAPTTAGMKVMMPHL